MPAQHLFTLVPAAPRPIIPGELHPMIFANRTHWPAPGPGTMGNAVYPDIDLPITGFANLTTFPAGTHLTIGPPEGEIDPPLIVSTSSIPAAQVSEAPPDAAMLPGRMVNVSGFGAAALPEAPPDGVLRATTIIGAQSFGVVLVLDDGDGPDLDDYGPIAFGPIGADPL